MTENVSGRNLFSVILPERKNERRVRPPINRLEVNNESHFSLKLHFFVFKYFVYF